MLEEAKPLLFRPDMVRALRRGQKTVTRRPIHPQPLQWDTVRRKPYALREAPRIWSPLTDHSEDRIAPYVAGELRWVQEGWRAEIGGSGVYIRYLADGEERHFDFSMVPANWKIPKPNRSTAVIMPRWASRILLRVTAVWPEQVQAISIEEIMAEGLRTTLRESEAADHLLEQWRELWDSIYHRRGYRFDDNPWAWRIGLNREAS